jgi:glycosyltransferase involved in cell wall biosynthesis
VRPARILFVSHTGEWGGGAEVILEQMIAAMRSLGYSPCLVAPTGKLVERLAPSCDQIATLPLPLLRRTSNPLMLLPLLITWVQSVVRVTALIARWRVDLVHANSGVSALAVCLPAALLRRRLVWHQHDIIPARLVNRIVLWPCGRLASTCIACSQSVAGSLERLGIAGAKIVTLYPVVREEFLQAFPDRVTARKVLGLPAEPAIIAVIGRLAPRKGQDIVLQAARSLRERGVQVHVVIAGSTPEDAPPSEGIEYIDRLRQLSEDPLLRGHVTFVSHQDDVRMVFAASDILAVPSYAEPFGIVILEAFAANVPVIAAAAGGPAEIVEHEVTGLLIPPGEVSAFAAAILKLLTNADLRKCLIKNAHAELVGGFTERDLPERVRAIYEPMLRSLHDRFRTSKNYQDAR